MLNDDKVIRDTFINNTAFNHDSFDSNKSLVAGYIQGQIIKVTYFSQNTPPTDIQSQQVDLVTGMSENTQLSLTQIRDFELRLQNELSYDFDADENISSVESSAATWPGFEPKVGDAFFYELRNGNIGVFVIGSVQRAVLGQETYHIINFTLQQLLDKVLRDKYISGTTDVYYFDKKKFLVGSTSYLTSNDYAIKNRLLDLRPAIINRFVEEYYDPTLGSFIRPDNVYDPYLVEYWKRKVNIYENETRPVQLLINVSNYNRTIWSLMTGNPIKSFANLEHDAKVLTKIGTYWDASITSLVGSKFVAVGRERAGETEAWVAGESDGTEAKYVNRNHPPLRTDSPEEHERYFDQLADKLEDTVKQPKPPVTPTIEYRAPYPILTNSQLRSVWKKIHGIDMRTSLDDAQLARAAGYISWYRARYPGTLTKYELYTRWSKEQKVLGKLDRDQQLAFVKYIREYRSRYVPVQTDEEIRAIYEIEHKFEDYSELDILEAIREYRYHHGYVADDSYDVTVTEPSDIRFLGETLHPLFTDVEEDTIPEEEVSKPQPSVKQANSYAFSHEFYCNGAMDGVERIIYDALHDTVDPEKILAACETVLNDQIVYSSDEVRLSYFYKLPVCIFLIDRALKKIMQE